MGSTEMTQRGRWAIGGLALAIVFGVVMRLVWPGDMEWKGDEQYLFFQATGPRPFPWLGQASSVGTRNPGMGIWVYSVMVKMFGISTPVGLVRCVMGVNVLALLALALFVIKVVPVRQREPWLWATALLAVNPVAILFSRKLWVQCVLPPFVVGMLLGWWRRGTRCGAFVWGMVGAWLGQIHMSGFFFAAGFVLWAALFDRESVRWRWWLLGSVLGAATLFPWVVHVLDSSAPPARSLATTVRPAFFALWVLYPLGFPLLTSFGSDTSPFLAWPTVGGTSLHLVAVAGVVIVVAALAISVEAFARTVWPRRLPSARPFGERRSDSGLALGSSFWGFGILVTLSGFVVLRHYLIVAFVLPFVALTFAALVAPRRGRGLLVALIVAEAALSVGYLSYIHVRGGARQGDYGVAYDHQSLAVRHG